LSLNTPDNGGSPPETESLTRVRANTNLQKESLMRPIPQSD